MKDTLYFDGRCPLCAKEITLLRRLKESSLELVDIHSREHELISCTKSKLDLLSVLHLKTSKGDWLYGVDASVSAWRHTSFGWILMPLRWPVIRPIVDRFYDNWANKRACKLGYRDDSQVVESK